LESIWSFFVRLTYLYAFIASSELFSGNPMWRLSGYITHTGLFWIVLGHVVWLGRFCCFWLFVNGFCLMSSWGHHMTSWGNSSLSFSSFSVLFSIYEPCHFWQSHCKTFQ
jgi:hypothetical protein